MIGRCRAYRLGQGSGGWIMSGMKSVLVMSCVVLFSGSIHGQSVHQPKRAERPAAGAHRMPEPTPNPALIDPAELRFALLDRFYPTSYLDLDNLTMPSPEFMAQRAPVNEGPFQAPAPTSPPEPASVFAQPVEPAQPVAPEALVPQAMEPTTLEPMPNCNTSPEHPGCTTPKVCPRCNRPTASCTQ